MSDKSAAIIDAYNEADEQLYDEKKQKKHKEFLSNLAAYISKYPDCYCQASKTMAESYIISRNFQENLLKAQCRDTELCLSNFALSFKKNNSKKASDAFSYIEKKLKTWEKHFFCNWDWLFNRENK